MLNKFTMGGEPVKDLHRFAALCNELGNPHEGLNFIHIAGTNGKGSVSEFISRALVNSGAKTCKFTSPYIYDIRERIQLNNRLISDKDFCTHVKTAAEAALRLPDSYRYSQFEILTAAAFLYFRDKRPDCVVLETGIGGLLDCTNIVRPRLSVITAIDYDHADILGSEIKDIAAHKAGIIKTAPCIMYPVQERSAYVEIKKQCGRTGAELITPDINLLSNVKISVYGNEFIYNNERYATVMGGYHQVLNAVTAVEVLRCLGVSSESIRYGLSTAQLPARMQILRKGAQRQPLVILDGAHNCQGLAACKSTFSSWRVRKAVVFGVQNGKDYLGMIRDLSGFANHLVFTDGFSQAAVPCSNLCRAAALFGFANEKIFSVSRANKAVELAQELCGGGMVLVTGSLRLAAAVNK